MRKKKHQAYTDEEKGKYFNNRQPWTKSDDALLDELSDYLPDEEISKRMGRTLASIWSRRMKLDATKKEPESSANDTSH